MNNPDNDTEPAFDDDGRPVPVYEPPEAPPAVALAERLQDMGADFPDLGAALRAIDEALDQAGLERAGEALGIIFARLPGGRRGAELRAALLGTVDGDLAGQARALGVSKQAFWLSVKRLTARIWKTVDSPV
jgi:hypothetical protein